MRTQNPNCDGGNCISAVGEVRVLPTGGDSNAILCRACFDHEMRFRRERNKELAESAAFDLTGWLTLKVYNPGLLAAEIKGEK